MNAIKKQLQMLKLEKDLAMDKADLCDQQAKEANRKEEKLRDEVCELAKKLMQMEHDLKVSKAQLIKSNKSLDMKERIYIVTQSELAVLNRKMQQCMQNLEKSEERRLSAQAKLAQAMETAEDAKRICKVLENRSKQDEERMDQLMTQLKEARLIAEDADTKSDDISKKLAFVEDELEAAEERVKSSEAYVSPAIL
ncbi:hypothetical protein ACFW04_003519 [Cataglyphis niger]